MPNPYSRIFKAPGAKGFAAAGFIARLPVAMATIGTVAMLSQIHGEYWLAGAVSATFALTNAFVAPQISRLVDRRGQFPVLIPATALSVFAFALLIVAARYGWPSWTLFVSALLAASMPSMPAMVRARWTELYRGTPELNTAFAFESVADELVYVAGSSLAVGLSVSLFPEAGPLASTLFLAVGSTAFILQRSTEPKVQPAVANHGHSAARLPAVQIITFALVAIGTLFGTAEVTVIAMTKEFGQPAAATFVLGGYALGSLIVGLVFGMLKLRMPLSRQFAIAIAVAAATTLPLLFVSNVPMLAVALFASGVSISPTFITAFSLIERLVPPAKLTEGITWVMTGIGIGMAVGSFTSGWVIDEFGAGSGFWVSVVAGAVALLAAVLGQPLLSTGSCQCRAEPRAA
ncbi:MFS transporter [Mesorhizobium sp. L-8-3]|uniref:MFS transporter n=1 Tax=Mesorhizobium sp. L-8-3 TaxID=2744522 RepID=UPI001927834F|nr:MFS transporter [Mesorhizobium sp. L-8-3]BCH26183.1 MFS transporter [Mesorhizobium sp. L-8-3]